MTIWTYVTGWTLVHFVWQGAVIGLLAAVLLRVLRGSPATVRYAIACVALGAMLLAPVITAVSLSQHLDEIAPLTLLSQPSATDATLPAAAATTIARTPLESLRAGVSVDTLLPLLVLVWFVGVVLLALRMARGAWRVHRIHRTALTMAPSRWSAEAQRVADRLGLTRAFRVVDAAMVATPAVVGCLRPVVLLPIAAFSTLTPEQIEAILAHELAHIRRHDGIVNLLQVLAETVLFYHPAVWWVSSRIRTEREHCCDDVAVAACGDPVRYAEALTELAAWNTTASRLALSATSGSLIRRVRRILGVSGGGSRRSTIGVLTTGLLVLLLVTVGAAQFFAAAPERGRSGESTPARAGFGPAQVNDLLGFELLPGRPQYATDDPRSNVAWQIDLEYPGGRVPFKGFTGRSLIRYAYGLTETPIVDVPAWLDSESLQLSTSLAAPPTEESARAAIRAILEERLHLATHDDTRNFPVYELVRADANALGPRLRPASGECSTFAFVSNGDGLNGRPMLPSGSPDLRVHVIRERGIRYCGIEPTFTGIRAVRVTMDAFAANMRRPRGPGAASRPVIDRTGLDGEYDFTLTVGPLPAAAIASRYAAFASFAASFGVRTIQAALQEQLGRKLEEATAPVDVLVVDRADRPSAPAASTTPNATLPPRLTRAPWAGAVERVARFAATPAQTVPGSVSGTFTDQLNNFLPAVHLTLVNEATGQRYDATTGRSGDFAVSDLPAGSYRLTASLPGFRETTSILTVQSGINTERSVVMAIGMIEETILVVNDGIPPAALPSYQRRPVTPPPPSRTQGMGGNLRPPRKLRHVAPIYPASGAEGVVILTAVISLDGTVTNTRPLSSPDPDLAQAAMDAVNLWEFDPTLLDGIPVDTLMQVTVSFSKPR
jgi:uncharacterized protein (TIGR03435 family)